MSVFGERSECAETPKKKIKKSEIAKKKFGSRRFWRVGRSTANRQNFKDGPSYPFLPGALKSCTMLCLPVRESSQNRA